MIKVKIEKRIWINIIINDKKSKNNKIDQILKNDILHYLSLYKSK